MSYIEKEKLIKADIASIENRVRHAFNQGYDLGFKDGKSKQPNCSEIPTGSTTKNDLGVDAVSRQAVIDLMMQKWGENFSGDDAMQESIDAIREMPSVTPQEPKIVSIAEIKYDEDKLKELVNKAVLTVTSQEPILDKIRAEIEQLPTNYIEIQRPHSVVERDVVELGAVMRIIDKYKAESEPQESEEKE